MMQAVRLVLMRHAKAADGEGQPDHDRPLTSTGESDAAAMGRWLRDNVAVPEAVMCSSALRARQTWAAVAARLTGPPEPSYLRALYQAGPGQVLELLQEVPADIDSLLVVGHNPTMQELVAAMTGRPPSGFPAGALAVLDVEGSWTTPGAARLQALVRPDGLTAKAEPPTSE
jgi:phosphohistidine phosphatase